MSKFDAASLDRDARPEESYSTHREPRHVGGKRYVRCEGCGRELLVCLGGREKLVHTDDCPVGGDGHV